MEIGSLFDVVVETNPTTTVPAPEVAPPVVAAEPDAYDPVEVGGNSPPRHAAPLSAPFTYFGGKRRVAAAVWQRFGDVGNYVEPFFGSGAVLLSRQFVRGLETVNDLNGWLCNFWRAVRADPDGVAEHADWPASELDLHARGDWLYYREGVDVDFVERLRSDPDWYDVKSAGWWVWGQANSIASGWNHDEGRTCVPRGIPVLAGPQGVNRWGLREVVGACPTVGGGELRDGVRGYFQRLSDRLRYVRLACGDWARVTGPSITIYNGVTAVFLDPPYELAGRSTVYGSLDTGCSAAVREWAIANGDNPLFRIALCGYDGEHEMPGDWEVFRWKATGGFGNVAADGGRGRDNAERETIWFSPHCASPVGTLPL
jgi:hypothetical protein